jgi:hypothetical protein
MDKTPANTNIKGIELNGKKIMEARLKVNNENMTNNSKQTFELNGLNDSVGEILSNYPVTIKINSIQTSNITAFSAQASEREKLIKALNQVSQYQGVTDKNGNLNLDVIINVNFTGKGGYTAYAEASGLNGTWISNAVNWTVDNPIPENKQANQNSQNKLLIRTGGQKNLTDIILFTLISLLITAKVIKFNNRYNKIK